ncbi:MAG: hypothetical protein SFV54_16170 [Bryobacteraceae bacterium]|nr:hypothetical protein [Bryobacteraceae bacterium]
MIPFEEEKLELGWWWECRTPAPLPARQQFSLFSWLYEHKNRPDRMAALRQMMRAADPTIYLLEDDDVLWHLVARLYVGEAVFCAGEREPEPEVKPVFSRSSSSEGAAAPAPRQSSAPREEQEASTLSPNADAAAQAAALTSASEAGIPFCEECLRQAAMR